MQSTRQAKVTGVKASKGEFTPDGETKSMLFDSTTIFVEARLKGDNSKGYASQALKWGKSDNAKKISHLEFPLVADIVVEDVTDGRGGSSMEVLDVKPVARVKAA